MIEKQTKTSNANKALYEWNAFAVLSKKNELKILVNISFKRVSFILF